MNEEELSAEFEKIVSHFRSPAEHLLETFFGERCKDFEPECLCCQRWKALDDLTQNPFQD